MRERVKSRSVSSSNQSQPSSNMSKISKQEIKKLFRWTQSDATLDKLVTHLNNIVLKQNEQNEQNEQKNGVKESTRDLVRRLRGGGNQETLLHRSCAHGSLSITTLLINYFQPDLLDARNDQRKTPLHEACTIGSAKIVSMLLECGALSDAHRTHSWTPLMYAVCRNHSDVCSLFIEHMEKKEKKEEEESCHRVAFINQTNQDGMTALYLASRENALACVEILLERGQADPNIFTNTKRTPLHVAIKFQNARCVS